jgi:hypothetical protein
MNTVRPSLPEVRHGVGDPDQQMVSSIDDAIAPGVF